MKMTLRAAAPPIRVCGSPILKVIWRWLSKARLTPKFKIQSSATIRLWGESWAVNQRSRFNAQSLFPVSPEGTTEKWWNRGDEMKKQLRGERAVKQDQTRVTLSSLPQSIARHGRTETGTDAESLFVLFYYTKSSYIFVFRNWQQRHKQQFLMYSLKFCVLNSHFPKKKKKRSCDLYCGRNHFEATGKHETLDYKSQQVSQRVLSDKRTVRLLCSPSELLWA